MKLIEKIKAIKSNRFVSLIAREKSVSQDVNIFLFIISFCYSIFYLTKQEWVLFVIALLCAALYISLIFILEKNYSVFSALSVISVLIFTVINTSLVGWESGFQLFIFAEMSAIFFTTLRDKSKINRTLVLALLFTIIYVVLYSLQVITLDTNPRFDTNTCVRLYIINSIITFITIVLFSYAYSMHSESRLSELSRRADFDELTKLYNRYAINQILETMIFNFKSTKKPFSVAIVDIDFFKNVNDTYGHNSGDDVLKGLAKILKKYSKKSGITVGRWGGEEFILISPPNIDTTKFVSELDSIRQYIESGEFVSNGERIGITISGGVERYREGWGPKEIVEAADKNLYRAKETGRNKVVF